MADAFGIILLAAGKSSRLGKPKQLVLFNGKSLLKHGVEVAVDAITEPVIVVLGANPELLEKELENKPVTTVINSEWEEGMASSIRCGLKKLLEISPKVEAAIIMVCDQPFVTSELLAGLIEKYRETRKPIITSSYENTKGTPALFDKSVFALLLDLNGDSGAKKIMKENPDWVSEIEFPLGKIDIDTEEDEALLQKHQPPSISPEGGG
jgi:molybdenum cofactor cytidylyltransferase